MVNLKISVGNGQNECVVARSVKRGVLQTHRAATHQLFARRRDIIHIRISRTPAMVKLHRCDAQVKMGVRQSP